MALENLTLFELHLENSRFGPDFGGGEREEAEGTSEESEGSEESSGRGLGKVIGTMLLVAVVAMAVRRYRSGGEEPPVDEETDQITIEHAAEQ